MRLNKKWSIKWWRTILISLLVWNITNGDQGKANCASLSAPNYYHYLHVIYKLPQIGYLFRSSTGLLIA